MILLKNGCSYSGLKVIPGNWKTSAAPFDREWYIYYRFYSPDSPKGKLKIIKGGLNILEKLSDRQVAVRALVKNEQKLLEVQGYNPALNRIVDDFTSDHIIDPETGFIDALDKAYARLNYEASTMSDLKCVIRGVKKAAKYLKIENKPVSEIRRRNIIRILDVCGQCVKGWSNARYNKYKSYLSILFKELLNIETVEFNPVKEIPKKSVITKLREVLTMEQRKKVDVFLKKNYYTFWRFLHIFYHSGSREVELTKLTKDKVRIDEQYFVVTVLKRGQPCEVKKPINNSVLNLWEEIYSEAKQGQFLFSKGLRPGDERVNPNQITRRWREHVKKKLGITADFYSLKHLNLDEVSDILSLEQASKLAGHLSTATTAEFYTVGKSERDLNQLKSIQNKFA